MAEETKAVTTQPAKLEGQLEVGVKPNSDLQPENKRETSGDQIIQVRALKSFHKDGDMKGDVTTPGDEFGVERSRAAQLRANGLIEYVQESDDHAIHGETDAKRIGERIKQQNDAAKIPANSRGTPLRNPEVKLAEIKDEKAAK